MASKIPQRFLVSGAALLLLSACSRPGDTRLQNITAGISKDSVFVIMGVEKPQRIDPYLVDGQYLEAMYFPKLGGADSANVQDRNMSPVVLADGKVVAWGWVQWDSMASLKKIEVAKEP